MPRHDQTSKKRPPRWERAFLAALAETGNVRAACEASSIGRAMVYAHRAADAEFAAEWESALDQAADLLEIEARRRAHDGVQKLKFDRGRLIMIPLVGPDGPVLDKAGEPVMVPYVEHEYSDTLMIFLLKGARPEKYRERTEITGKDGGPIAVVSSADLAAAREKASAYEAEQFGDA